jgi:ornithine carbamoyltransferase
VANVISPEQIVRVGAKELLWDLDLTTDELIYLLDLAAAVKAVPGDWAQVLEGRSLVLLFEKPSLRTRLTFELAIKQLGGGSIFCEGPIGDREPVEDVARNLDRWVDGIVTRTFSQQTVNDLGQCSSVPVINALSDMFHPCQALADMLTIRECVSSMEGAKLAFVGDGNNVAHSLMLDAVRLGMDFAIGTPPGYEPDGEIVRQAGELAAASGAGLLVTNDPLEAVAEAHVVYTDVWASMGQEQEAERRRELFQPFQVNDELLAVARPDAIFMHCLPAHREEEVTTAVIESERSVVFQQAENRLHAQKALLLMLIE